MIKRRASKVVRIGEVEVGGDRPVVVQSMTSTDTRNVHATAAQILQLEECGCEIVRVAVPDKEAAAALGEIRGRTRLPLVADIHFDYRLALAALESGVDGLRLNPGNISDPDHITTVVRAAKEREVPIRVGVNAGSLPKDVSEEAPVVDRMVEAALYEVRLLETLDFELIKVSAKAFDVRTTVEAYRALADATPYPLHLGITEAGLPWTGAIRSSVGLGILLWEGIGDTIRVSLTTPDLCREVECAYEILKALKMREHGPTLVSCPTCGRCEVDLVGMAEEVERRLRGVDKAVKVAVMGCIVNGPGEAKDADVGIACGKGRGVIFRKGERIRSVEESDLVDELMTEVSALIGASHGWGHR